MDFFDFDELLQIHPQVFMLHLSMLVLIKVLLRHLTKIFVLPLDHLSKSLRVNFRAVAAELESFRQTFRHVYDQGQFRLCNWYDGVEQTLELFQNSQVSA